MREQASELFFDKADLYGQSIWSGGPIAQLAERAPDKGEVPGSNPGRPTSIRGELAQLGERRLCKPEVTGSSPVFSTIDRPEVGNQRPARNSLVIYCWWICPPKMGIGGSQYGSLTTE